MEYTLSDKFKTWSESNTSNLKLCEHFFRKHEKSEIVAKAFQSMLSSGRKPNKVWVNKISDFRIRSKKDWRKGKTLEFIKYNILKNQFTERLVNTHANTMKMEVKDIMQEKYI